MTENWFLVNLDEGAIHVKFKAETFYEDENLTVFADDDDKIVGAVLTPRILSIHKEQEVSE